MRLFALLFALTMVAAAPPETGPTPDPPEIPTSQATGAIVSINDTELVVDRRGETLRFRLTETTRILVDAEPAAVGQLATGSRVRVIYERADAEPFTARQVHDAGTIAILDAELAGVPATIVGIEQREVEGVEQTVVTVDTEHGKRRALVVRPDGAWRSVIMREGEPAGLDQFAAGTAAVVSVRRTGGEVMYLRTLADEPTHLAFLALRTAEGTLRQAGEAWSIETADGSEPLRMGRATQYFKAGAAAAANPFAAGEAVLVKYDRRADGVILARAIFDRASWRAYAEAVMAQRAAGDQG